MPKTIERTVELSIVNCGECGGSYAINARYRSQCRDKGTGWTCPYCKCSWGYYKNNRHKDLEDQLERAQRDRDHYLSQVSHARRQRDNARNSHKKMRNRVKNGVCPCCNRTFQNLLKHMRTKHPEISDDKTLRQLREIFGMTQQQLSDEIGVSQNHISSFECGRSVTVWARDQIEAWIDDQGQSE